MANPTSTPSGIPQVGAQRPATSLASNAVAASGPSVPSFAEQQLAGTVGRKSATPAPQPAPIRRPTPQPRARKAAAPAPAVDEVAKPQEPNALRKQLDELFAKRLAESQAELEKAKEPVTAQKEATAPSTAETTVRENPDGSRTTEQKDYMTPEAQQYKKQLDDAAKSIDTEIKYAIDRYDAIALSADKAQAALIESIKRTFEVRKAEMERTNTAALNTQQLLGARSGRQRYAPEIQSSIISNEERAGIVRMTQIEAEELRLIAAAQQAATEEDLGILNQRITQVGNLRQERNALVQEMYEVSIKEEARAQQRATFALSYQTSLEKAERERTQFEREERELATNYAAINLVSVDELGNVVQPSFEEIQAVAESMEIDPMELQAKVTLRGQDIEQFDAQMRSQYIAQQGQLLNQEADRFSLRRSEQLLPLELQEMMLQNARSAFDNAATEREMVQAVAMMDSGQLSPADQKELLKNKSYKDLKGNELLGAALENFRDKVNEYLSGGEGFDILTRTEIEELQSLKMGLAATLKSAKTLGTLDQGVENLVNGLIGEVPEKTLTARVGLFTGLQTKVNSAIEQNRQEAEINYSQLVAENPTYANAPSVERLRRATQGLPTSFTEWANDPGNLQQVQELQQSIIDAGGNPSDPEDVEQAWNAIYGFSNESQTSLKGTDVSSIRDNARVNTSIGTGTATGIEAGSPLWQYGYDIVLDGGKGANVQAPFAGRVVSAGSQGAWGNTAVIEMDSGERVRLSHLDNLSVSEGDVVRPGQVVGTQGNTGRTLGKTGVHLDVTMYKKDGKPYSSQEVASRLQTQIA